MELPRVSKLSCGGALRALPPFKTVPTASGGRLKNSRKAAQAVQRPTSSSEDPVEGAAASTTASRGQTPGSTSLPSARMADISGATHPGKLRRCADESVLTSWVELPASSLSTSLPPSEILSAPPSAPPRPSCERSITFLRTPPSWILAVPTPSCGRSSGSSTMKVRSRSSQTPVLTGGIETELSIPSLVV